MHLVQKIVLFTFKFPYGQQETFLETEIKYLSSRFDSVVILPLFGEKNLREVPKNVEVLSPVFKRRGKTIALKLLKLRALNFCLSFWTFDIAGIKKLLKQAIVVGGLSEYLLKQKELQECSVWYFYWGTNSVNILNTIQHPKAIARFHRFDLYGEEVPGGEVPIGHRYLSEKLAKLVFISKEGLEYFSAKFPENRQRYELSYLGTVDHGLGMQRDESSNEYRIVSCSNIIPVKRVNLIADALSLVENKKIEWVHFGSGDEESVYQLKKVVQKFPENITFVEMGRRTNKEVLNYYKENSVDLFLNVSISEGLPVSIMEAVSFGIPIVATDCGGVREVVDSDNGALLPVELTSNELAICVSDLLNDSLGIKRKRSREIWEDKFSASKNYEYFCDIIESI